MVFNLHKDIWEDNMILLKSGHVYGPEYIGKRDILVAGTQIVKIDQDIDLGNLPIEVIDCTNKNIFPGFIDGHVHITGGGGEGSFKTRTPEIQLSDITTAGVTTLVGCLGTDGTTRTMTNLLAKAYALEEEGVSTYVYSGSYQVPVRTLTGDIQDDLVLIEKIIGVGEIAISDHRSSVPSLEELIKMAASARVGGMLAGKAGIINIHLGDADTMFDDLYEVTKHSELTLEQFLPTHVNRNHDLFKAGIEYAKKGGYIDFTTSTTPEFIEMGEVEAAKALRLALEAGVDPDRISFTSDGQGSLPEYDEDNRLTGLTIGRLSSLYESVRKAVIEEKVALEKALRVITANPAEILKLKNIGFIREGNKADLVLVDSESLEIETVIAKGQIMINHKEVLVKGTFE